MAQVSPEQVVSGLVSRGYAPHEAAGIAGNLAQESGFDTAIQEVNPQTESARRQGGGFGLAQWTSPERKQGLYNMAQMRGVPVDDLDLQLDYLDHELKTTHKKAYKALKSTRDPRHAAWVVSKYYEVPSEKHANNPKRMGLAEQFINLINPIGSAQADETPWQEPDQALMDEYTAWKSSKQPDQALMDEYKAWKEGKQPTAGQKVGGVIANIGGAVLDEAGKIGNTILSAGDAYNEFVGNKNALSSLDTTGKERNAANLETLKQQGYNPDAIESQGTRLGVDLAGTGGMGKILAGGAKAIPSLSKFAPALESWGMEGTALQRIAGGAATGGASSALIDPETAGMGAVLGGALPPAIQVAGKVGKVMGKALKGKDVIPQATKDAAAKALGKGFLIPPSQVNPTLANRLIEGTAGKITTAQNASARNQETMNQLAKKAIGAESLDDIGLQAVRTKANKAYDKLASYGKIESDDTFKAALDAATARTEKFKADFPGLKNSDLDSLVESLKGKGEFNSDTAIEAIKRLREDSYANKIAQDATKKELGRAQGKIATSLEDLVERNLEKSGDKVLLESYRDARKTLAKTHSVSKAVDVSTGNINANKLVGELQKGKLKDGELKDIAEFAQAFPKAAQNISKMGSLPQTSPLDVASVSTISMMAGHPGYMALLALRPAARKAALSKYVQGGLIAAKKAPSKALAKTGKALSRGIPAAAQVLGRD